jgi:hypothetical protein
MAAVYAVGVRVAGLGLLDSAAGAAGRFRGEFAAPAAIASAPAEAFRA